MIYGSAIPVIGLKAVEPVRGAQALSLSAGTSCTMLKRLHNCFRRLD